MREVRAEWPAGVHVSREQRLSSHRAGYRKMHSHPLDGRNLNGKKTQIQIARTKPVRESDLAACDDAARTSSIVIEANVRIQRKRACISVCGDRTGGGGRPPEHQCMGETPPQGVAPLREPK